ncbi:hypothetical protein G9C85_09010 [Halorubellus sp. JP-L1]|uniref:hypothetical protein n=1 Tax=Halorubellus sp. JP-L1 TaxID=2715753 RepID=UPI00140C106C|nr:hypothetical protein [Halorubellus sp. JP-L1]NHN41768.1 hypothetical protein [Halorubellus sp. JP-L1]
MSTSTPSTPDASHTGLRSRVGLETLAAPVRATCFYAALALPLAYVPLLVSGLETVSQTGNFFLLLGLHVLALALGHGHQPGE